MSTEVRPAARPGVPRAMVVGVVAVVGLASFALTRVFWPDPAGEPAVGPPANLLPGFVVLGVLESLLFGLGVAFLLAGSGPCAAPAAGRC